MSTLIVVLINAPVALLLGWYLVHRVRQRRRPRAQREQAVLDELAENENGMGNTTYRQGWIAGIGNDAVRELARGAGYEYTEMRGSALTFQRTLPGHEPVPEERFAPGDEESSDPDGEFLARLTNLRPDVSGTARIDMTPFPRRRMRHFREVAEAHGWALHRLGREGRTLYWVLRRPGTKTVSRHDPYWVSGPSLAELREYPAARAAARQAEAELGVDPLSDTALEYARRRHLRLYRRAQRFGAVLSLGILAGLPVLLFGWREIIHGGTSGDVLITIAVVLLGIAGLGGIFLARSLGARKRAVSAFTEGYTRVASAALEAGHDGQAQESAQAPSQPDQAGPVHH